MTTVRLTGLVLMLVAGVSPAAGQTAAPLGQEGLVSMVPPEAVAYVERRGQDAIHDAFVASNLGEMAADEAISQFCIDTLTRVEALMANSMFKPAGAEEAKKYQQLVHSFIRPVWYRPTAAFIVLGEKEGDSGPGFGFICATGKYQKECHDALAELMKIGVPAKGEKGTRQAFTYKSGMIVWQGVAKGYEEFTLPADPAQQVEGLRKTGRTLFMVSWSGNFLYVASNLSVADAMGKAVSKAGKDTNESLKLVMQKTDIKDWAFRWYVDVEALMKLTKARGGGRDVRFLSVLGLDKVRGVGGMGGYADKLYTRMTYIDAPKTTGGLLRCLKMGGSYKTGLSMLPGGAIFGLGGEFDTKMIMKVVRDVAAADLGGDEPATEAATVEGAATTRAAVRTPATGAARKLDEQTEKILKQIELLADSTGGNGGVYVTDLQSALMGMIGGAGMPVGFVFDLKDSAQAAKAVEELGKLLPGAAEDGDGPGAGKASLNEYRKIPIRRLARMFRIAIVKDRIVIALGDPAMKSGIDTVLDKTGGFEPGSKGEALLKAAGDGSAVFWMDLAGIAKLVWPMLIQLAENERASADIPLASLPSTDKIVRMLGPEIAVFQADEGGLLLKSRGKIPFSTKATLAFPFMWVIMRF